VPTGLFWTVPIPASGVSVDLDSGTASMRADDVVVWDYTQIANAIATNAPPPLPATISFRVQWSGNAGRVPVRNSAQGFSGDFIRNTARIAWSATVGPYQLVSAPGETSSSSFAEIGRERNGMFFQ
jgi:hypothetical protein